VQGLLPLRPGVRVGTASARRRALLRAFRPDLPSVTLRGNVPTRVEKLRAGGAEAVILAAAGLERLQGVLDLDGLVTARLDPALFVPAPAQGAIALQCRRDDPVEKALAGLHDEAVALPIRAERELLRRVEGGCDLPFGAWCRPIEGGMLELIAILEIDGAIVRDSRRGSDPDELAARVWDAFVAAGARSGTAFAAELSKGGEGSQGGERGDGSKGSQGEQDGAGAVYHEMVAGPGEAGSRADDACGERGD
jgi:hydroxymethylbilane synthase